MTPAESARIKKTALGGRFVAIKGKARWDVDADVREFEGEVITQTLAALVRAADHDGKTEIAAWLRDRVVSGRDYQGGWKK